LVQEWRELYTGYVLTGDRALPEADQHNPFHLTPHGAQLAGSVRVYLQPLFYLLPVSERAPIIDYKGDTVGRLEILLTPVPREDQDDDGDDEDEKDKDDGAGAGAGRRQSVTRGGTARQRMGSSMGRRAGSGGEVYFREGDLGELEGSGLRLRLHIKRASGLPKQCSKDVFVRYRWPLSGELVESEACMGTSASPRIDHVQDVWLPCVTRADVQRIHDGVVEIQVLGHYPHAADALGADPVWQRLVGLVQSGETRITRAGFDAEDAAMARAGVEADEAEVEAGRRAAMDKLSLEVLSLSPEELLGRLQEAYERHTGLLRTAASLEARLEAAEEARVALEEAQRRAAERKREKKERRQRGEEEHSRGHAAGTGTGTGGHAEGGGGVDAGLGAVERARLHRELEDTRAQLSREAEEVGRLRKELARQQEQLGTLRTRLQGGAEAGDAASAVLGEELRRQTEAAGEAEARAAEMAAEAEAVRQRLLKAKELRDREREEMEREAEEKQKEHEEEVRRLREALKAARAGTTGGKPKAAGNKTKQGGGSQASSKTCIIM
jgi:hypothetical protein